MTLSIPKNKYNFVVYNTANFDGYYHKFASYKIAISFVESANNEIGENLLSLTTLKLYRTFRHKLFSLNSQ